LVDTVRLTQPSPLRSSLKMRSVSKQRGRGRTSRVEALGGGCHLQTLVRTTHAVVVDPRAKLTLSPFQG
jgi:hypothetical protein